MKEEKRSIGKGQNDDEGMEGKEWESRKRRRKEGNVTDDKEREGMRVEEREQKESVFQWR